MISCPLAPFPTHYWVLLHCPILDLVQVPRPATHAIGCPTYRPATTTDTLFPLATHDAIMIVLRMAVQVVPCHGCRHAEAMPPATPCRVRVETL
jgi:hypothetical protein